MGSLGDGLERRENKKKRDRGEHQWYGEGWWCCFTGVCSTVGGPLSLPAPLNPSHLLRPWIRHTSVFPQPAAAELALSPVMHVRPLFPAFSHPCFHPLFRSLSECQGYQQCLGQDGQTLFYSRHVFIHAPHVDTCVSVSFPLHIFASPVAASHILFLPLKSPCYFPLSFLLPKLLNLS